MGADDADADGGDASCAAAPVVEDKVSSPSSPSYPASASASAAEGAAEAGASSSPPDGSGGDEGEGSPVEGERREGKRQRRRRSSRPPARLLFGSCNNQNLTNPLWDVMVEREAAAFVWGGDSIYADRLVGLDWTHLPPRAVHAQATPDLLRQYYAKQLSNAGYGRLLATNITVFGTIDDHDYGQNNGDRTYEFSRESGTAFVEFTGEPEDSPIAARARAGHGVYGVKVFDFGRPPGSELVPDDEAGIDPDVVGYDEDERSEGDGRKESGGGGSSEGSRSRSYSDRSVAVFVLDVRTNRTPWGEGLAAWRPDDAGDFLGERQWRWFETALRRSRAAVNVIVNGLQVHADRFPSSHVAEEWVKFPSARRRLYRAVLSAGAEAPVLISGDVHMAQLLRKDCFRTRGDGDDGAQGSGAGRPLVEITTSGLTHSWGTGFASSEKYHKTWRKYYVAFGSRVSMLFGHAACPWTELVRSGPTDADADAARPPSFENGGAEGAKRGKQFSLDRNFGELEFDFEERAVRVRVVGERGGAAPLLSARWGFDQLSGRETMPGGSVGPAEASEFRRRHPEEDGEWICVNHRGEAHPFHVHAATLSGMVLLMTLLFLPYLLCLVGFPWVILVVRRRSRRNS